MWFSTNDLHHRMMQHVVQTALFLTWVVEYAQIGFAGVRTKAFTLSGLFLLCLPKLKHQFPRMKKFKI